MTAPSRATGALDDEAVVAAYIRAAGAIDDLYEAFDIPGDPPTAGGLLGYWADDETEE